MVVRVVPLSVPALPLPDESAVVVPAVSSKPQAPTSPLTGEATVNVAATVLGDPVAPGAVIVRSGIGPGGQARRVDTDVDAGGCCRSPATRPATLVLDAV